MPVRTMGRYSALRVTVTLHLYIYTYILGGVLHIMYIHGVLLPLRSVRARLVFSIEKTQ